MLSFTAISALLLTSAVVPGCDRSRHLPDAPVGLTHLETSQRLPLDSRPHFALRDSATACVLRNTSPFVLCGDRSWSAVDTLATDMGEGPGELMTASRLVTTPNDDLGVVDYQTSRLTIFSDLSYESSTTTPQLFRPLSLTEDLALGLSSPESPVSRGRIVWIDLKTESVVRQRSIESLGPSSEPEGPFRDPPPYPNVVLGPDSIVIAAAGMGYTLHRIRLGSEDHSSFSGPAYTPEPPSPRDVDDYREQIERLFGRPPTSSQLSEFRESPRSPLVNGAPLQFDSAGRLWVATTRDHVEQSKIDLFRDTTYVGEIVVDGRLLWFDIHQNIVAVMSARSQEDSVGLHPVFLDWYEMTD